MTNVEISKRVSDMLGPERVAEITKAAIAAETEAYARIRVAMLYSIAAALITGAVLFAFA